jgi:hypothetical protein
MKVLINGIDQTTALENGIDTPVAYSVLTTGTTIEVQSERPLTKLYWVLTSPHDGVLASSYFNGTVLTALSLIRDTTNKLKSQGWVTWERPSNDSKDGGFYRYVFVLSGATVDVASTIRFVGVVFSEDKDLRAEYPNVTDYLPAGDTTFIRFHVSAREAIVQWFRGKGAFTLNGSVAKNLTEFDFLDVDEVKNASKFMALAKLFAWLSDSPDDKWYQKSKDFYADATNNLDVYFISLDKNRDGNVDQGESLISTDLVIRRA